MKRGNAVTTTAQSLGSLIKSARDIMRKDKGLNGDLDRLPMLTWVMFLKFLDDLELQREEEAKLAGKKFQRAIDSPYRWRDWAAKPEGITGDELISFVNNEEAVLPDSSRGPGLFAYLRGLAGRNGGDRRDVIATVFKGTINRMINGYLLRDVINKVSGIHFGSSEELHTLGALYETMLREMRDAAGDSGEFYTPRPVVRFMVAVTDPKLGETILDPACGTGGFLVEAFMHLEKQCKTVQDRQLLQQRSIFGGEAKPLPYLLAQMNLLLHGLESPQISPNNSLAVKITEIGEKDRVDIILTNPPFGGEEERGILANFPSDKQTAETALLFLQLIMRKLRRAPRPGRAAVVVPNGTLFGDGIAARIKEELLREFNLHTVIRLPAGVFSPYTDIETNILFFDRAGPTNEVWFYEHPSPEGRTKYTKTKPLRFDELGSCMEWFVNKGESPRAWMVGAQAIAAAGYNLDLKNPRSGKETPYVPPEALLSSIRERHAKNSRALDALIEAFQENSALIQPWPLDAIRSAAKPVIRRISPKAGTEYRMAGVRLWGEGVYEREPVDGASTKYGSFTLLKAGDIVVNKIWARNGSVGVVPDELDGAFVTSEFPVFEPDRDVLEPNWFRWVVKMSFFWNQCDEKSRGTTAKNRIRPEKFLDVLVPLPDRSEQKRIVAYLNAVDGRLIATKRLQAETAAELDALIPSILDKAFKGEL